MVSHPENGSDSPIGSDRDRGRDRFDELSLRCLLEAEEECCMVYCTSPNKLSQCLN